MIVVALVIAAVIAFAIAALVVGRESQRLGHQRYEPVYRIDEAVEFISERLPYETAAELTPDNLRQLLRLHLNYLQFEEGSVGRAGGVLNDDATVAELQRRARDDGLGLDRRHVGNVLDGQLHYLRAIGAIAQ